MTVAVLVAGLSLGGWSMVNGPLDPSRSKDVAKELATDPEFAPLAAKALNTALAPALGANAQAASLKLAASPKVLAAVADVASGSYRYALTGEGSSRIDAKNVADAAQQSGAPDDIVNSLRSVTLSLNVPKIDAVIDARKAVNRLYPKGFLFAVLLATAAFAVAADRGRVLRRAGRWCVFSSLLWILVGLLLPRALVWMWDSAATHIARSALTAATASMLTTMVPLAITGAALWMSGKYLSQQKAERMNITDVRGPGSESATSSSIGARPPFNEGPGRSFEILAD